MADEKKGTADLLSSLLAEQKQIAADEKKEIEQKLREREEQERSRREQEAQRQRELLQQRLEEEKKRADERFRKRQERLRAEADPERGAEGAPVAAAAVVVPQAPVKRFPLVPVLAVAAVVIVGVGVGVFLLLNQDKTTQLTLVRQQANAVLLAADTKANALLSDFQREQDRLKKEEELQKQRQGEIQALEERLRALQAQGGAKTEALEAELKALRDQQAAADQARTGSRKGPRKGGDEGGLKIEENIFKGGKLVK